MLRFRYTNRTLTALQIARKTARVFQLGEVTPECVLIGLIEEGGGQGFLILSELLPMSVSVAQAKEEVGFFLTDAPKETVEDPPHSALTIQLLQRAWDGAQKLEQNFIGTEHVLLSITLLKELFVRRILTERGVTSEMVLFRIGEWKRKLGDTLGQQVSEASDTADRLARVQRRLELIALRQKIGSLRDALGQQDLNDLEIIERAREIVQGALV